MSRRTFKFPGDLHYTKDHFWIRKERDAWTVGLTDYGQYSLGDILYIEIDPPGALLSAGDSIGTLEAGKWVGALRTPAGGVINKVHEKLRNAPGLVNADPYGDGWLYVLSVSDDVDLLDASSYQQWVEEEMHREEEGLDLS